MTKIKSVEEAVKMIEVCAIKEYEATENGDYKTNNKYARYEAKCIKYLYEHNKLCTLHEYLKHEHSRVRLSAAYALLPIFENECVKVLNEIANGNYGFSGISAKMILMQWYDGELKFPYQTDRDQNSSPEKVEKPSVEVNKEEHVKSENFSPETLRLSRLFECTPTGDNDLHNEQAGLYVSLEPAKQERTYRCYCHHHLRSLRGCWLLTDGSTIYGSRHCLHANGYDAYHHPSALVLALP